MDTLTLPKAERIRKARALALKEAVDRFNHESMGEEERLELRERILRLKRQER